MLAQRGCVGGWWRDNCGHFSVVGDAQVRQLRGDLRGLIIIFKFPRRNGCIQVVHDVVAHRTCVLINTRVDLVTVCHCVAVFQHVTNGKVLSDNVMQVDGPWSTQRAYI